MRTFLGLTVTLFVSAGLLFLTTTETTFTNTSRSHLKVSFGGSPETLDPAQVNGMLESRLLLSLYEGLTRLDPETLEPKQGVARRWTVSEDRKTWTFYFRTGSNAARWSNGEKVRPEHFEFAWKRVLSPLPPSPYDSQLYRYIKNAGKYYFSGSLSDLSSSALRVDLETNPEPGVRNLLDEFEKLRSYGTRRHLEKLDLFRSEFSRIKNSGTPTRLPEPLRGKVAEARSSIASVRKRLQRRDPVSWNDVGIKTGTNRLTVTLKSPTPYFASLTAFMTYYPVYPPVIKKFPSPLEKGSDWIHVGDETKWTKPEHMVTNGPFQLSGWTFNDRIVMRTNPHYHDSKRPHVDRLTYYSVENSMTAMNMFLQGDLHLTTEVPNQLKKQLRKRPYYHDWIRFNTECLRFNVQREPLDDPRVRKAIAMAIDREKLTENIARGGEKPTTTWVPDAERWYEPPEGIGFHPERARELLAEAGYPGGKGIDNIGCLITDNPGEQNMFVGLQNMLKKHLGINLKARKKEWGVYLSEFMNRNYDICLSGWIGDYYDPMTFLDMFITGGKNNRTNWGSSKYDRIIRKATRAKSSERRVALLKQAETILVEKALPLTPLYHPTNTALWNPDRISGVAKNSIGIVDLKYVKMQD